MTVLVSRGVDFLGWVDNRVRVVPDVVYGEEVDGWVIVADGHVPNLDS